VLYLLDVDIDYLRMSDRLQQIRAAEHARVKELIAKGFVVVEWLKANGRGVFAVWTAHRTRRSNKRSPACRWHRTS
jgi:hypothetical protein